MHSRIKSLLLTFFLHGPFPPGTASQSLLMASLFREMKGGQRSKYSKRHCVQVCIYDLDIMWIYGDCAATYIMVTVSLTDETFEMFCQRSGPHKFATSQ